MKWKTSNKFAYAYKHGYSLWKHRFALLPRVLIRHDDGTKEWIWLCWFDERVEDVIPHKTDPLFSWHYKVRRRLADGREGLLAKAVLCD